MSVAGVADIAVPRRRAGTRPARVLRVARETHDTFTLTLQYEGPEPLVRFAPGQFSMLYAFGVGELPISISGDPEHPVRPVYTVRSVGPATYALVTKKPGELVGVRGPFGTSWPLADSRGKDILIVARRHWPCARCGRPSITSCAIAEITTA